jgi:ATP/ADP translocase/HEAT repeat protein
VPDGRVERFVKGFGDVRGREARAAVSLAALFFLITATFYIIKPIKESFLIGFTRPSWWSYADLATALLIGFVVALNARFLDRLPRQTYLTASLLFFIASVFVFWYVFELRMKGLVASPVADPSGFAFLLRAEQMIKDNFSVVVIAFCFWADIFISMSVTQFWISVNDVFDPHQAKRLVGLFVTGGLFGGIAGSGAAALATFARVIQPEDLLLVCPVLLVLALVAVNVVYTGQRKIDAAAGDIRIAPTSKVGYLESFRTIRRDRYLLLLASMLAAAMVAGSLINYQFKTVVNFVFPDAQARTSSIAVFFLVILVVSTVFHLTTTGRVLKSYGIRWAISLAPIVLLVGSAAVFFIPLGAMLAWAWVVRGSDKTFDNTLSQSVRELLYIPVAPGVKYRAKIFIDMFVSKFATGLGAALFLALFYARHFEYRVDQPLAIIREIGLVALFFLLLWLALTRLVYREYPAVLKKDLGQLWMYGQQVVDTHIDEKLVREVFEAIQSRERSTTLYYMNVFNLVRTNSLTPELKELLGIKRDELKARAMDALLDVGGGVFYPGLEEAITDTEFQKEIGLIYLLPSYQKIMDERLGSIAASASELDRIEAANSICRMVPSPSTLDALARLLQDPSSEVALYALNSAAVHRRPEHVPLILRLLANPMTVAEAQAALASYGPGIEDLLAPVLGSTVEPLEVRRAIPEVLARIETQKAADILVGELARRNDDLEASLVDALYKIRTDQRQVRFRERDLRPELRVLIRKACDVILDPPGSAAALKAQLDIRIKRIFDLLTLMYPREDVINDYQNILQGTPKSVDYALEHLDNLLDREDKELLFPLIEDLPAVERALRLRKALKLK